MNKKQKRGFTLVELLATLAVLSLVVTISVFTSTSVINKAREKSYEATVNNILVAGGNYSIENPELSGWTSCESGNCEYQCISVNELISNGYFTGDILESEVEKDISVTASDFIYVERDKTNKTIINKKFEYEKTTDKKCTASALGNIEFKATPGTWAREKTITITYTLNSNQDINNTVAEYEFTGVNGQKIVEKNITFDSTRVKSVTVKQAITENGTLTAKIGTFEKKLYISTIDKNNPTITKYVSNHNLANNQTVSITIKDNESGIKGYYFGKIDPNSDSIMYEETANVKEINLTKEVDSAGTWYLRTMDSAGNVSDIESLNFSSTKLNVPDTATVIPGRLLDVDNTYNLSNLTVNTAPFYTFKNWRTREECDNGVEVTNTKPGTYSNLYACVTENLFGGSISISGKTESGNKLTVNTSSVTLTNHENDSNVTFTYQWYKNDSNSNSGGTKISGATSKTYTLKNSEVSKYIYVVVTASRDNYVSKTYTSNVSSKITSSPPVKVKNTITVSPKSLIYNGNYQQLVTTSNAKGTVYYSKTNALTSSNYSGVGSTSIPTGKDVGSYTVYWYVTGNNSYSSDSGSVSVTISKASNPITVSANSLTYNGSAQQLVTTSGAQGTVWYSTSTSLTSSNYSGVGSTSIPTKTSMGTYTVYYYVTGNSNYNSKNGRVSVTISCGNYTCPSGYVKSGSKCCPKVTGLFNATLGSVSLSGGQCVWTATGLEMDVALPQFAIDKGYSCGPSTVVWENCNPGNNFGCIRSVSWTCRRNADAATCKAN